jgi:hypothetical protein
MSWQLQQINGGSGPTVPNEYVACPQAPSVGASGDWFVCTFNDQQHFTYLDGDNNLQDCYYDGNNWNLQQITGVPKDLVVCSDAPAVGASGDWFVCAYGNQLHFTYLDENSNLQDCWYDGVYNVWHLQQINGGSGPTVQNEFVTCPQAPSVGEPGVWFVSTFVYPSVNPSVNEQHFTYIDENSALQDCWYDGNNWQSRQINGGSGPSVPNESVKCPQAPAVGAAGALFVSTSGSQQHFIYIDEYTNLQDCWFDGAANDWNLQQINGGSVPTVPNEFVTCPQAPAVGERALFVCTFESQQHYTYLDSNNNLQDCFYDGNNWNLQQITGGPGPSAANVVCPLAPAVGDSGAWFVCTFESELHFTYLDGNSNLQDCYYDGTKWTLQQITVTAGGPPGGPAFVCSYGNQLHFTYLDHNNNIQDVFYSSLTVHPRWGLPVRSRV